MCFRPGRAVKKRQVMCPKCKTMNPLPLSVESALSEIMENEDGKAILEKHVAVMLADPRFPKVKSMNLKMVKPFSGGKITQKMVNLVAEELSQLPWDNVCTSCGETLPEVKR